MLWYGMVRYIIVFFLLFNYYYLFVEFFNTLITHFIIIDFIIFIFLLYFFINLITLIIKK